MKKLEPREQGQTSALTSMPALRSPWATLLLTIGGCYEWQVISQHYLITTASEKEFRRSKGGRGKHSDKGMGPMKPGTHWNSTNGYIHG